MTSATMPNKVSTMDKHSLSLFMIYLMGAFNW